MLSHIRLYRTGHSIKQLTRKAFLPHPGSYTFFLVPSVLWKALTKGLLWVRLCPAPGHTDDQGQILPLRDPNIRETRKPQLFQEDKCCVGDKHRTLSGSCGGNFPQPERVMQGLWGKGMILNKSEPDYPVGTGHY